MGIIDLERQTVTVTSVNSGSGKDGKFKTGGSTTSTGSKMSSCSGSMDSGSMGCRTNACGQMPVTSDIAEETPSVGEQMSSQMPSGQIAAGQLTSSQIASGQMPSGHLPPGQLVDTDDPELLSQLKFVSPKSGVFRPVGSGSG